MFFTQLLEYTIYHFNREAKIQIKMGFPGHFEQKKEHQSIVSQLEEVNAELQKEVPSYRDNLLDMIRKWVVDHLIVTDRALAPHLKKLPGSFQ
jgi:hemerythrin-like metal-binding protein